MRFIFSTAFLLMANLLIAQSSTAETDPLDSIFRSQFPKVYAEIGHSYPSFSLKNKTGTINNNSIQGRVVLINFWFEGCAPCMAEMEALNSLFDSLKRNKDFVFISIARDNPQAIARVKKKYGLSFEVFSADEKECKRLNFGSGYPTSIILDRTGIIKHIHIGGIIEKDGATDHIMNVLLPEIQTLL